jgi:hypothetical protein
VWGSPDPTNEINLIDQIDKIDQIDQSGSARWVPDPYQPVLEAVEEDGAAGLKNLGFSGGKQDFPRFLERSSEGLGQIRGVFEQSDSWSVYLVYPVYSVAWTKETGQTR